MSPRTALFSLWFFAVTAVLGSAATPIDFSSSGYRAGMEQIPTVNGILRLEPSGGDDTERLLGAIAALEKRAPDAAGWRGALVLAPGRFQVRGPIRLNTSGVVIRGSVNRDLPTVILATGLRRDPLFILGREPDPQPQTSVDLLDETVPAGTQVLHVPEVSKFAAGDRVTVTRPTTKAWVEAMGMNKAPGNFAEMRLHWTVGSRNLVWNRCIASVDTQKGEITLDAPITAPLEKQWGGGQLAKSTETEPPHNLGLENLVLESDFRAELPADEEHAWFGVLVDRAEDAFVRGVTARHFVSSAVFVSAEARRVTVSDCRSEDFVSEIGGYRRDGFTVLGQQVLVENCVADGAINAFNVGFTAAGPIVFLNCQARRSLGPVGPSESWAAGILYENVTVEGASLELGGPSDRTQGAGWTATSSVAWNCRAEKIAVNNPPAGGENFASSGSEPLFARQRAAAKLAAPGSPLSGNLTQADARAPVFKGNTSTAPRVGTRTKSAGLEIVGGRFVVGDRTLWGGAVNAAWWRGQIAPATAPNTGVSVTRFVPGRTGPGLTENLDRLAARMGRDGLVFFQSGPGLWYERRRDDHLIEARPNGDVWAPFYELPWERTGKGKAQDGLSLYDVSHYNPWYFERTHRFAELCTEHGLVLYNFLYNTHNVLETVAHYVDYPWRPANNVNRVPLPEPPPLDDNRTVHLADRFYSAADPELRQLHRAYIRHQLDTLGDQPNIVFSLAFQFAGPLAFQQFFLDTVAEWQTEHQRRVRIALVTSRDITEAILADKTRAALVDVIDTRYWQTLADGTEWAPRGDRNRAFRELNGEQFGKAVDLPPDSTPLFVYRQVRSYRTRFPEKAVVSWHGGVGPVPVLMAGGAQALMRNPAAGQGQDTIDRTTIDGFVQKRLAGVLMKLQPDDALFASPEKVWCLAALDRRVLLVSRLGNEVIRAARDVAGLMYRATWLNAKTGETSRGNSPITLTPETELRAPFDGDALLLLEAEG